MRPERWPAAGTRGQAHQDPARVPRSFLSGVMGSALEVLGIKQQYASSSFIPADKSSTDEGFVMVFCVVRLLNRRSFCKL